MRCSCTSTSAQLVLGLAKRAAAVVSDVAPNVFANGEEGLAVRFHSLFLPLTNKPLTNKPAPRSCIFDVYFICLFLRQVHQYFNCPPDCRICLSNCLGVAAELAACLNLIYTV